MLAYIVWMNTSLARKIIKPACWEESAEVVSSNAYVQLLQEETIRLIGDGGGLRISFS